MQNYLGEPAVTKFISANGWLSKERVHDRWNKEIKSDQHYRLQY